MSSKAYISSWKDTLLTDKILIWGEAYGSISELDLHHHMDRTSSGLITLTKCQARFPHKKSTDPLTWGTAGPKTTDNPKSMANTTELFGTIPYIGLLLYLFSSAFGCLLCTETCILICLISFYPTGNLHNTLVGFQLYGISGRKTNSLCSLFLSLEFYFGFQQWVLG